MPPATAGQKRKRSHEQNQQKQHGDVLCSPITIRSDDSTPEQTQETVSLCSQSSLEDIASFHCPKSKEDRPASTPLLHFAPVASDWHAPADKKKQRTPTIISRKQEQIDCLMRQYKDLYVAIKDEFLVPVNYQGHVHDWVQLDAGMCVCNLCGAEHICFRGDCPTVQMEQSEHVCSISGCVIVLSEMKAEWGALDRVHTPAGHSSLHHNHHTTLGGQSARARAAMHRQQQAMTVKKEEPKAEPNAHLRAQGDPMVLSHILPSFHSPLLMKRTSTIHDTVEMVVREILDSPKTARCLAEEAHRDQARQQSCLAKLIRELAAAQHHGMQRPNMLHLEAKLSWQCHKCRRILVVASALSPSQVPFCRRLAGFRSSDTHTHRHTFTFPSLSSRRSTSCTIIQRR